jgi:DNA processing protein
LHICSGLALGIDSAAHRGALATGGKSVAVMATGIDRVYPQRHQALAAQLEQAGCLVTEFLPGTPPLRHNFPKRNRIISGLSLGVLVIEAALPSGSLITAGTALEQGREVFALPWSMLHDGGRGCLQLIRDGAKMVQDVDDILEELGSLYARQACANGRVLAADTGRL